MAQGDQLEVVSPMGDLLFFDLDEGKGVTNVGRHPSNDVVINGQGIADFHLVIDHRSHPYQVSLINADAVATLGNEKLVPNRAYPLQAWDTIMIDGFAVILMEESGAAASAPPPAPTQSTLGAAAPIVGAAASSVPPASPGQTPPPTPQSTVTPPPVITPSSSAAPIQDTANAVGPGSATMPPPSSVPPVISSTGGRPIEGQGQQTVVAPSQTLSDIVDETLIMEVSTREVVVNVEETATWQIRVVNGGSLVARFEVHVEGWIDGSWVEVEPGYVNLVEAGQGVFNVGITPPRMPTSRAGTHQLAVVVTSPNYPGLRAQRAITLVINPYYDFHVGDVTPRQQSVNYFRRSGQLRLPVQNRGNSELIFRLEGADDENLVTFEMDSPIEATRLVRQVEFPLEPNQTLTIPISATPRNHRFIGVGPHVHSMTLTTTMLAPQPATRSVLAQLRNRPVVGPWLIFALGILLAAILIVALQPKIDQFAFAPGVAQTEGEDTGEASLTAQGAAAQVANLQGAKIFGIKIPKLPKLPKQLAFLNKFWPGGGTEEGDAATAAAAASLARVSVEAGSTVTLIWSTTRAASLTIEKMVGAERQFIATIDDPWQQRQYTFSADVRESVTYILTAHNWIERLPLVGQTFGLDEKRLGLIVGPVEPKIEVFNVDPTNMVTGQAVNISWQVVNGQTYELRVNNVQRPLETARGSIQEVPNVTTDYQLVVTSPYWDVPIPSEVKTVKVSLPTPVINNFDIEPKPIVDGDIVRVAWDVAGAANVNIDPLPGDVPNLLGQDEVILGRGRTEQTFTLVASLGEGEQRVTALAQRVVEIVQPTPTPTPTFTPPPTTTPLPPTATPIPSPLIRSFDIQPRPIVDGENVQVNWAVEGASSVEITPAPGAVNLEGLAELTVVPGKSQETFTLRAVMDDGVATVVVIATRVIPIVTPTPTITPTPTQTPTQTPQTPVIQVFTLSPREVVRGDTVSSTTDAEGQSTGGTTSQPELTWTVVGDATMVEVTGPDFGPVRNLPKQGTLRVPADQTTVYQLNVYLGEDIVASLTQELTVLEPTPTPTIPPTSTPLPTSTPTATPTATPNIVSFTVNAVEAGDVVAPVSSNDDIPTYQVTAGTLIRLAWRIENPVTEVRLTDSSNDYGARSPEDEFQLTITSSTVFQLTVTGSVSRRIRINVLAIPAPPAPFNVNGIDGADNDSPATVTWDYPGESQGSLLGFRVYRANIDNFNFSLVADRFELDNTVKQWTDPSLPSCNRVYYVVGVYEDITRTGDDRIQETAISPTSWYTRPCP